MPLVRTLTVLPLSVPAGTFTVTGSSSVGTLTWAPSAASTNVTGTRTVRFAARAPEDRVGPHVHHDVEVAGRSAVRAGRAAALHPDALAVVDARRDADLHLALAALDAAAAAPRARVLDDRPPASTARAHLGERERTLVDEDRRRCRCTRGRCRARCPAAPRSRGTSSTRRRQ